MKSIPPDQYKVVTPIELKNSQTLLDLDTDEKSVEKELKRVRKKLGKLQDTLYAHGKYAVLICIQGMDTAGKDRMIRGGF